jgi:hypothetical protein
VDLNSPEFAKKIISVFNRIIDQKLDKHRPINWCTGKVETAGSGATIPVYINDSAVVTTVRNPRGLNLSVGDTVFIWLPNYRVDNMAFIDHKL